MAASNTRAELPNQDEILLRGKQVLDEALRGKARLRWLTASHRQHGGPEATLEMTPLYSAESGKRSLLIEPVRLAAPSRLKPVVQRLLDESQAPDVLALLVVPYMSPDAASLCRDEGVLFVDLCGNVYLDFPPWLHINVFGHPNRFQKHHISGAFSKKGSRITRALLCRPGSAWVQKDLSSTVGLSEGYTSKVVQALEREGYVRRTGGGIELVDAEVLLDAWRSRARIAPGDRTSAYFWGRTRQAAEQQLAHHLATLPDLRFAYTGPSAAYELAPHADYRISGLYVSRPLTAEEMAAHKIELVDEGANLWIIVPKDRGVFQFGTHADGMPGEGPFEYEWNRDGNVVFDGSMRASGRADVGIPVVNAIQAYVDLHSFPGRAREAAEELMRKLISRGDDR